MMDRRRDGLDTLSSRIQMNIPPRLDADDVLHTAEELNSPSFFNYTSPGYCMRACSPGSFTSDVTVVSPAPAGNWRLSVCSDANRLPPEEFLHCDTPGVGVGAAELSNTSQRYLSCDVRQDAASSLTTLVLTKSTPQDTIGA